MNKDKIKKGLKSVFTVFVIISAILLWIEIIFIIYGLITGWFDEPIEVNPGIDVYYLG